MSNTNNAQDLLNTLSMAWLTVPDWRFGQLICNIGRASGHFTPYALTDDEIMNQLSDVDPVGYSLPSSRSPKRIPGVIAEVASAMAAHPDLSVAQIVCEAVGYPDPFYIEDDALVEKLQEFNGRRAQ